MLVTFSCKTHENITMFGDIAQQLLKMMGHSGTVPSAMLAEEVPQALEKLKTALAREKNIPPPQTSLDEEDGPYISLSHRAIPLMELLEDAAKHQCNVMWK